MNLYVYITYVHELIYFRCYMYMYICMYKPESSLFQMMEDFSGLALPPLFGGHILEAELEPGGVELGPGEVTFMITVVVIGMVMPVK